MANARPEIVGADCWIAMEVELLEVLEDASPALVAAWEDKNFQRAPPWMSWTMGRAVGLSFNHVWPSASKISS